METEIITINQGRARSPYFVISESPRNCQTKRGSIVKCIHPRTKEITKGIVCDHWTFEWKKSPAGLLLLGYGVQPEMIRKGLIEIDKTFEDEMEILVLVKEMI